MIDTEVLCVNQSKCTLSSSPFCRHFCNNLHSIELLLGPQQDWCCYSILNFFSITLLHFPCSSFFFIYRRFELRHFVIVSFWRFQSLDLVHCHAFLFLFHSISSSMKPVYALWQLFKTFWVFVWCRSTNQALVTFLVSLSASHFQ